MQTLAALEVVARGGGHGGAVVFKLLFLLFLGFLAVKLVRGRHGIAGHGSALGTLQDRFARGEIDQAEFDHRQAVLKSKKDVPPAPARPAPAAPPTPGPVADPVTDSLDSDEVDDPRTED